MKFRLKLPANLDKTSKISINILTILFFYFFATKCYLKRFATKSSSKVIKFQNILFFYRKNSRRLQGQFKRKVPETTEKRAAPTQIRNDDDTFHLSSWRTEQNFQIPERGKIWLTLFYFVKIWCIYVSTFNCFCF